MRFILSTTVDTLMQAPQRKFIQVEQYVVRHYIRVFYLIVIKGLFQSVVER